MNPEDFQYGGFAPPVNLPSEKADLLDKIKPTVIVDLIALRLKGMVEVNGTFVQSPALAKRSLTEQGVQDIVTLMLPVSSQNVSLSKLKDSEIRHRSLAIARRTQEMCLRNWEEYGIKSPDQLGFIHEIVFSNTFITLKQPENEGIRSLIKNVVDAPIQPMQEEKGGFNLFRR